MASPEIHRLLAKAFGKGDSESFPLILEMMVGPAAAELLMALPATADELAQRFPGSGQQLQSVLDKGFEQGLLLKRDSPGGGIRYHLSGEITETILVDARNDGLGDRFLDLWREEFREFVETLGPVDDPYDVARVIPVEGMIGTAQTVLPYESLRAILEKAERRVVLDCACRKRAQNCDMPIRNMCFWLDDAANYFLERGAGREITVERGMEIFWQADQLGLVHLTDVLLYENTAARVGWICNCCTCCCAILKKVRRSKGTVTLMRSFRAEVNSLLCERCGLCGRFCHFGAFRFNDDGVPVIDADRCVGCGLCASQCAHDAIKLVRVEDPGIPESTQRQIIEAIGE
ncbi:MAG: 4Fe-4S binding protein [Candidatus Eisenbacteria sp.]|nr:4Fe-4S binding protein [Candidatus Eisenbacteria bacterium]